MQLDIFDANGGHKTPTVLPTVNGILNHVMETDHKHHPMQDATFLEWGRYTQDGIASCDQGVSDMGALVRMDVGEFLTSTDKGGDNPVTLHDEILYEEPNRTWNTGYTSGIWRTKCGRFY